MENHFSHSRSNPNRSSSTKKPYNGPNGGFTSVKTATTYDDVFGGPPRFGPPTLSPRLEDYSEIFSGFNGSSRAAVSSIPVLDLPLVDDKGVYFDVRRESFDYREVFGGFSDLDLAPSYEELFMQRRSTVADGDSSDDAWTPEEVESFSGKSPSFSNGRDSYDSIDGCTEFNISYNKANQMNGTNMLRVADLGAVPGYTVAVDEMVGASGRRKVNHKETGPSSVAFKDKDGAQKYYGGATTSCLTEPFVTVSEIGLKTHPTGIPPPSRPPPVMKSDFRRSASNSRTTGSEGSSGGGSPPFFDVEVDASSAAVREAMVKAEAKLKSAKELFERKPTSMNNRMREEGKSSHAAGLPGLENNVDVARKPLRHENGSKPLSSQGSVNSEGNEEWEEATQFVELVRTEQPRNADENSGGEDVSFPLNAGFFDQKLRWTANADREKQQRRARGDREDHESKKLPKHPGARKVASKHKRHEDRLAEKAPEEPKNEKLRDDELQFKKGNNLSDHGGLVKHRNLLRPEENEHFTGEKLTNQKMELHSEEKTKRLQNQQSDGIPYQKAAAKNQGFVFDWEQNARKLREALGLSDNESTLEVPLGTRGEMDESETKLKEALKRIEEETSSKEARVKEETEAFEKAENEIRLNAALEQEEKVKKLKETREKEENERRAAEARVKAEEERKMKEQERRLKEAFEKEEENRRMRVARDKAEQERRRKEQEEYEMKLKEAFEKEEKNRRMREAREKAENERKMKVALEQEKERKIKEAREREENERRIKEAHEKAEVERRMKETLEREEMERRAKELQERRAKEALEQKEKERKLKEALEQKEKERRLKEAREKEENEKKLKEGIELEEKEKRLIEAFERAETERRLKEDLEQEEMRLREAREREERERTHRENQERQEKEMKQDKDTREERQGDTCEIEKTCETTNEDVEQWLKENLSDTVEEDERVDNHEQLNKVLEEEEEGPSQRVSVSEEACPWKVFEKNLKDASQKEGTIEMDAESGIFERNEEEPQLGINARYNKVNGESGEESASVSDNGQGGKLNQKSRKVESSIASVIKGDCEIKDEKVKNGSVDQRNQEGSKCANKTSSSLRNHEDTFTHQQERGSINETRQDAKLERPLPSQVFMQREKEAERLKRELDSKMERLRKMEEEKEREREREKDRMAFDQRALADARERLEKACAEARERSFPDKATMDARLRAERAAVERATAEARERAAEKAAFEARDRMERSFSDKQSQSSGLFGERMERSVSDKQFQNSASFGASRYQSSPGADGESPQRYTSRLERHRRTADRVAKALAEKNMRDLVAQREQAERSRIAETLDAEVKRWSNGKEGNIRALLSTLQYILGSESGWQPVPLTEVITSAAVKRAYRKATLCVHPDKLQQRGANIHQKYICEKVFDLLKEAWNRFNSEER